MMLSVCIVNFNSSHLLKACLESIFAHPPRFPFEVIVVDNDSSDGSERVVSLFPDVRFIRNQTNVGFAVANNQAFAEAGGESFLLLNPDTEVRDGALNALLDCLDAFPN